MKDEKTLVAAEKQAGEERRDKRRIQAPCAYRALDPVTKRMRDFYPPVSCLFDCEHCGWNPEVKEKRVAKMLAELEERRRAEAREARRSKKKGIWK